MSNKSGTSSQAVPLPQGGGALSGIGETFAPDLFTGTGNLTVPLALPPGRNGFEPQLHLAYSSGNGNGPFGLGWSLNVPGISRKTADGVPRYRDSAPAPEDRDVFVLSGTDDLVAVAEPAPGVTRYRPRTEGLFARIDRDRTGDHDVWRVSAQDGLVSVYGAQPPGDAGPAVVADPAQRAKVFRWQLAQTTDPFGNRIDYRYQPDRGSEGPRSWDQSYLREVRYVDVEDAGQTRFLVSVVFVYEPRPDPFSDYRAGFEIRTRLRCRRIEVHTHADADIRTRTYELAYVDDLIAAGEREPSELPANGVSLLGRMTVVGHDGARTQALPPLDLRYSRFAPEQRRFRDITARNDALPPRSLADDDLEMVDLFGNGLPDIVQMNGTAQFWRNLGGGTFDTPRQMDEVPAGVQLRDPGVQFCDTNGDGRADLLVLGRSGYFPLSFQGRWSQQGFVRYPAAPAVDFDGETRLVDLDGDGVVDALRTGTAFELFFNDPRRGWDRVETRPRGPLEQFPDVSFSDPRVQLADLSGDGLQDVVLVQQGRIDYWPYLGHGRWGRRITMRNSPVFRDSAPVPGGFDPARVLFGDLDGDGLDDVVYVEPGRLTFWVNRGGDGWSDPTVVQGTPPLSDPDAVRVADMLGSGTAGVLWTFDRIAGSGSNYRFLDVAGDRKPYLLEQVDNGIGAVTRVRYSPSTTHYLADVQDPATRWRTPLPFPVQVVDRVEVVDQISQGKLASELRYHHGYWDGTERELRGFGMVEQLDTQVDQERSSAPTRSRTWFHLGPVGDELAPRQEADLSAGHWPGDPQLFGRAPELERLLASLPATARADALRSLRGRVLRTELFALDDDPRSDRPFTVTETQHEVREESPVGAPGERRRRVFFPHALTDRTTRWDRGDDPQSRFTFCADYDEFGHARQQTEVACPRGWRRLADRPAEPYLATRTRTVLAAPLDPDSVIHDKVARTTTFDIRGTGGMRLLDLATRRDGQLDLAPIAHSVNHYDGAPFVGLPAGQVGSSGALTRRMTLVLTEELLHRARRGGDLAPVPPYLRPDGPTWTDEYPVEFRDRVPPLAGFVFEPGDAAHLRGYYVPSERSRHDAHGLVVASRDPLGSETTVRFDRFALLPVEVHDPVGLVTRADHDYRVLLPRLVTDVNGNRQAFGYTPLGLLERVAQQGKQGQPLGDTLERPGTLHRYDLRRVTGPARPISVRTTRRVHHVNGSAGTPGRDDTVDTVEYSDGFGRLVQVRTRAERTCFGDARFGRDVVAPAPGPSDRAEVVGLTEASEPNVVVSGAQVYDDKGRPVERYEPFFSQGWDYAPPGDAERGHGVTISYDPLGRLVRTVDPDGSEQRVVMGIPADLARPAEFEPTPWESYVYDANDNAGRTHPDQAGSYRHHWDTPTSGRLDARGRVVAVAERHRPPPGADGRVPALEELVTHYAYDGRDRLVRVTDPLGRLSFAYDYDLADGVLRTESIDAGAHSTVLDARGNEVERRSGRGCLTLESRDPLGRRSRLWARDDSAGPVMLRERLEYGDAGDPAQPAPARADARANNRLGALHEHYDEAGLVRIERYDFKANGVAITRQVVSDDVLLAGTDRTGRWQMDWEPPVGADVASHARALLDPTVHQTDLAFDALNRAVLTTCPEGVDGRRREIRAGYDQAGSLERVSVAGETVVDRIAYNAKGQRSLLALGNGLLARYAYDPGTSSLARLRAERATKPNPDAPRYRPESTPFLDLQYRHDLAGNLVELVERTQGSGVRANPGAAAIDDPNLRSRVAAGDALVRRFAYDSLYRVVSASGRACQQSASPAPWTDVRRCGVATPGPGNAADLTAPSQETYSYDAAGNLTRLHNTTGAAQFNRKFTLRAGTNRLQRLTAGGTAFAYTYDADGNIVRETNSRHFTWDHANRLAAFAVRTGSAPPSLRAIYLYDAGGQRVKKLVRTAGGDIESVTYVGGVFERHRWRQPATAGENDRLLVIDGEQRVASLRIGPAGPDDRSPAVQYNLGDHLGSAVVTLDGAGELIDREEYSPYGETSFGTFGHKRYRFCGNERDVESGLYYVAARYYAPGLGRWVTADPIGLAGGMNPYTYTESNPVNLTDSTGLQPDTDTVVVTTPSGANYGGSMESGFERVDAEAQILGVDSWWTDGSMTWEMVYAGSGEVIEVQGRTETINGNVFSAEDGQYAMLLQGEATARTVSKAAYENAKDWSSYIEGLTPEQLDQAFGGVEALGRFLDKAVLVGAMATPYGRAAMAVVGVLDGTETMVRAESNSERMWAAAEIVGSVGVPGIRGAGRAAGGGFGSGGGRVQSFAARPGRGGGGGRRGGGGRGGGGGGGGDLWKPRDPSSNPSGGGPYREIPPWGPIDKPPPPRAPDKLGKKLAKALDRATPEKIDNVPIERRRRPWIP